MYDHVAVIVAEDVTSRFLNVISLLHRSGPTYSHPIERLGRRRGRYPDCDESSRSSAAPDGEEIQQDRALIGSTWESQEQPCVNDDDRRSARFGPRRNW